MSARTRLLGISAWLILAAALGVCAAWPIYQTWWLVVPATVGTAVGVLIGAFVARRFGLAIACATLFGAFVLTVVTGLDYLRGAAKLRRDYLNAHPEA